MTGTGRRDRWLRRLSPGESPRCRLICLHCAGSGPGMFRNLPDHLPADVAVEAVLLPGRENRIAETPFDRMGPLVEALAEALGPRLDLPYAFFGYSMGAQVSYNLTHVLRTRELPLPSALFVAASPGPYLQREVPAWNESDERLVAYLRDLGGTAPNVLDDPDLLDLLLPTLRADLTAVATWPYRSRPVLPMAIRAFSGAEDGPASPERMGAWRMETHGTFRQSVLPGGHFFINDSLATVADVIAADLLELFPRRADTAVHSGAGRTARP
ncbi:thioesterase II family protein [Streptomyces sp. NPDC090083]|uniref:thioesterase II family protein n=1 Tax=Streptomyces sp. NPDC090083 TaxID=3365941 RepID=UPI00381581B8